MKSTFFRLAGLLLLIGSFASAAPQGTTITAKEIAQGYRDFVVLAKPRTSVRNTVDAAEAGEGLHVRRKFARFGDLRVLELTSSETVAQAVKRLQATGRYDYVEPDHLIHALKTPNDPLFSSKQWSLSNTGSNGPGSGVAGADIGAVAAWDTITDASSVVVAVIDSGARLTHDDLAGNLWSNPSTTFGVSGTHGIDSTVSSTSSGYYTPTDQAGHGTHVSGIIGAVGNNSYGITGVAWKAQLMELKFIAANGYGSQSDEMECINFAIANGVKVINASFGSNSYSSSEFTAIQSAAAANIIFVAAAGNATLNNDTAPFYPADYPLDNIVSVAATDNTDTLASFSDYGPGSVDLAAPGVSIYSTWYVDATGAGSDISFATESGTSMAAPHVTGAIALLLAKFPSDTYRQTINRLLRSVTPIAGLSGKVQTGGRLNLANAITSTSNTPFNDNFASRAIVTGANVTIRSNNTGATEETGEPMHAGVTTSASLWWSWTAPATTSVFFDTSGSGYSPVVALYTGTALSGLTPVASNDSTTSGTSRLTVNVTANTTYQIAVASKGASGATGLTLLAIGSIPANDNFANAQLVTGSSFVLNATTLSASRETGEPDPTAPTNYAAGHTVWYRWVAPTSGHYGLSVYSSLIDMLAGVYTGPSVSNLTKIAWNDDAAYNASTGADNTNSYVSFTATAGTTYYFQIDTTNVNPTGGDFTLTLADSAWQYPVLGGVVSSPAIGSSGTIYFGAGTSITDMTLDSGNYPETSIYALNSDGTKKWSYATGQPIELAAPAIGSDGTVYLASGDDKLYALNGTTGALKWTYTGTTPLLITPAIAADGTIYFRDDTTLYALTDSGTKATLKWTFPLSGGTYSSPAVAADGTIYVGATGGAFYAVNPSGTQKWKFTGDNDIYTSPTIATDGTVYFGTLSGSFYALNSSGSQKWIWAGTGGMSITSSPSLAPDGTIYFGAYDHKLHALTSAGQEKWSYTLGDQVRGSSPAVGADGTVYIGAYDGLLYAINASGGLVRTYPTGNLIRSSPAIANGLLTFGSADGQLYAFNLNASVNQAPAASAWPVFHHDVLRTGLYTSNFVSITTAPASQTVAIGGTLTLTVAATGPGTLSYQWYDNGAAISGATGSTYSLPNAQTTNSGSYTVTVTSSSGPTATSSPAVITVTNAISGRLVNLSVRTTAGTGAQTLIAGFVVSGGTKSMLVRGIGPALIPYGVTGALPDPELDIYTGTATTPSYTNTGWGSVSPATTAALNAAFTATGAFTLPESTSKDAALLISLAPGVYSAQIKGASGDTGVALAELYDDDGTYATGQLTNVSARAQVGTGNNILIAGFVISGTTNKTVLIRGIGPALTTYGVTGALADPRLDLYVNGASTPSYTNTAWGSGGSANTAALTAAFTSTGAFPLTNTSSNDSALLVSLPPGVYSAQVKGASGDTGVALIEVYLVQ